MLGKINFISWTENKILFISLPSHYEQQTCLRIKQKLVKAKSIWQRQLSNQFWVLISLPSSTAFLMISIRGQELIKKKIDYNSQNWERPFLRCSNQTSQIDSHTKTSISERSETICSTVRRVPVCVGGPQRGHWHAQFHLIHVDQLAEFEANCWGIWRWWQRRRFLGRSTGHRKHQRYSNVWTKLWRLWLQCSHALGTLEGILCHVRLSTRSNRPMQSYTINVRTAWTMSPWHHLMKTDI